MHGVHGTTEPQTVQQTKDSAMELDQLRYFLAIADLANFTRAAEELGLSQSALSRSILKLEEELGQPVFERKTRSVTLTDVGTLL